LNTLQPIYENDRITFSARELHNYLEVKTQFKDWFPRMCEYGFTESIDFNPLKNEQVRLEGGREVKREIQDYQLTIDTAKEIAMIQRNEKGKQARKYFIELEKAWNSPEKIMARALSIANEQINSLRIENNILKPKAEVYNQLMTSETALEMSEVAKVLDYKGVGRNTLFEILRENEILRYNNEPYQKYVDNGYFRVIQTKYKDKFGATNINIKTMVYQKGVRAIMRLLDELGYVQRVS